jgi:hypothetical protein
MIRSQARWPAQRHHQADTQRDDHQHGGSCQPRAAHHIAVHGFPRTVVTAMESVSAAKVLPRLAAVV